MKLTKKHWIIIGGAAALLGTGIYLSARNKKKKSNEAESKGKGFTDKIQAEEAKIVREERVEQEAISEEEMAARQQIQEEFDNDEELIFPLKKGSEGYPVSVIQTYMNSTCKASLEAIDAYPTKVNGVFDKEMEESCKICASVKRAEIDENFYNRVFNDLKAANILPEVE